MKAEVSAGSRVSISWPRAFPATGILGVGAQLRNIKGSIKNKEKTAKDLFFFVDIILSFVNLYENDRCPVHQPLSYYSKAGGHNKSLARRGRTGF
jgi:hypothetical protein